MPTAPKNIDKTKNIDKNTRGLARGDPAHVICCMLFAIRQSPRRFSRGYKAASRAPFAHPEALFNTATPSLRSVSIIMSPYLIKTTTSYRLYLVHCQVAAVVAAAVDITGFVLPSSPDDMDIDTPRGSPAPAGPGGFDTLYHCRIIRQDVRSDEVPLRFLSCLLTGEDLAELHGA